MAKELTGHNKTISIAKGMGILLMVVGHSGCYSCINHWLYMFHMPLFFFLSGFLFKDKYLNNKTLFLKRKIKGLYFPFVTWVIIFALLHNTLTTIHINSTYYTPDSLQNHILSAFIFHYDEALVGGYWFLRELFYANIIAIPSIYLLSRLHYHWHEKPLILILSGLILSIIIITIAWILSYTIADCFTVSLLGSSYILTGYLYSKIGKILSIWASIGIIGISFLFSLIINIDMSMLAATGKKIFLDFPMALICIIAIISICSVISGKFSNILDYIGSRTLDILTFHFISMKFISLFAIFLLGLEIDVLTSHPTIPHIGGVWWIGYSAAGLIIPIALINMGKAFTNEIKLKMAYYKSKVSY